MPITIKTTAMEYKGQDGEYHAVAGLRGKQGPPGEDYILTPSDKADIEAAVIEGMSATVEEIRAFLGIT